MLVDWVLVCLNSLIIEPYCVLCPSVKVRLPVTAVVHCYDCCNVIGYKGISMSCNACSMPSGTVLLCQ